MTVIFDFDGTIADSFDYVAEFLLAEAKVGHVNDSAKNLLRGMSMQAMARELAIPWYRLPRLFWRGRQGMAGAVHHLQTFEYMPEVIRKLHAEGHEMFILSSNSVHNIHSFLNNNNLETYFLEVYGSVGLFGKSTAIRRLLKEHQLDAADAVYIGDELRDAEAAKSVGVRPISVLWGFARLKDLRAFNPDNLAAKPDDIIELLEQ